MRGAGADGDDALHDGPYDGVVSGGASASTAGLSGSPLPLTCGRIRTLLNTGGVKDTYDVGVHVTVGGKHSDRAEPGANRADRART